MTAPLTSISGLISGIDTSSLIDAIIAQERAPAVRMETQETDIKNQQTAVAAYRTLLANLNTAATALQDGTGFGSMSVSASVVTGTRLLGSATATSAAAAGTYLLKVSTLAAAEKLGSTAANGSTNALGYTGSFTVNGQAVTVSATDTLANIRDRINTLNSGTTATGVSASILTVSPTDSRLILTSAKTGAAGATLVDTTGTTLQSLGFLDNTGAKLTAAQLTPGSDANFTLDGIPFSRTTNTVDDAIDGVTISLSGVETGASTSLSIAPDSGSAVQSMASFVTAYNALITFVQAQGTVSGTTSPALYNDSIIRTIRTGLPTRLLQTVLGVPADLATAASVGLSLGRDGKLTLDQAKFSTAFTNRPTDLRNLLGESRSATGSNLTFASSGTTGNSGTWAVNITAAASKGALSTSGFNGTYDAGATADSLTLTDAQSGRTAVVSLTTGMTTAAIVSAMQAAITSAGLTIDVGTSGNDITLTSQNSGSAAGLSFAVTGLGDGASEAFGATGSAHGTDVAGTIGGYSATGSGEVLVGDASTPAGGLTARYTGAALGNIGDITLQLGTATSIKRLLDSFTNTGSGLLDARVTALNTKNDNLVQRVSDIDARLARRRLVLVAQFSAMEASIASLKQQASSLLGSQSSSSSSSSSGGSSLGA